MCFSSSKITCSLLLRASAIACCTLVLALAPWPASAQAITVQNGGTITVENGGVWDLNGTTVDLGDAGSTASITETGGGRFTGGQLTATRTLDAPWQADPAGLGIEISSSETLGETTVTRGHAVQTGSGNESIERYYNIQPATNSGLDATLTFNYLDAELNGLSESTLEFFRSTDDGSTWNERGQDDRDANANTVTLGGIDALSRWTLGSEDSPLPVELARFDATADGESVQLTWATASETNNAGFEVERKRADSDTWTPVGFVDGHDTTSEAQRYSFSDADVPYTADSLSYRLKQIDIDGSATLSQEVEVAFTTPERLALRGNYPNPFTEQTTIRYELPQAGPVRLAVYNVLGQRIATLVDEQQEAGRQQIRFDASDLASGTYFIRLSTKGTIRTQKLTVVQ